MSSLILSSSPFTLLGKATSKTLLLSPAGIKVGPEWIFSVEKTRRGGMG